MGESLGTTIIGQDEKLMPFITSCNIACGYHGGDDVHTPNTINLALEHNVRIGAHPSYPDIEGFGRRPMHFEKEELATIITTQVLSLKKMVEEAGGVLTYVKPHGALYNKASINSEEAQVIIAALKSINPNLALMGLAGSEMGKVSKGMDIEFISEAFCDRKYELDGSLMLRSKPGAVFSKVEDVVKQVESIVFDKRVETAAGKFIAIQADSICIHGDNPMALEFVKAIHYLFSSKIG